MKTAVVYIHGKGGAAEEAEHYKPLFPACEVIGFDYRSATPREAMCEFSAFFDALGRSFDSIILIANSIGAYFALHALKDTRIEKAFFISPIVDMEKLIADMMRWTGVSESELMEKGTIETSFGETLSRDYLLWVRAHPLSWHVPTSILRGSNDDLQSNDTLKEFAEKTGADLTIMENGGHWFHTEEEMDLLDRWIRDNIPAGFHSALQGKECV